jgi:hypothetical protein
VVVFSIRVKRPGSVVGRVWNLAQDACGVAAVALVVLKLTGLVNWSWWWVLSPLWLGGFLLAAVLCGLLVLLALNLRERAGGPGERARRRLGSCDRCRW